MENQVTYLILKAACLQSAPVLSLSKDVERRAEQRITRFLEFLNSWLTGATDFNGTGSLESASGGTFMFAPEEKGQRE
jgi:hypothetical protein